MSKKSMHRAQLKDQVWSIKIKATRDSAKLVELYHAVQTIAAKIKASRSLSLLKNDEEYIPLVAKHLGVVEDRMYILFNNAEYQNMAWKGTTFAALLGK